MATRAASGKDVTIVSIPSQKPVDVDQCHLIETRMDSWAASTDSRADIDAIEMFVCVELSTTVCGRPGVAVSRTLELRHSISFERPAQSPMTRRGPSLVSHVSSILLDRARAFRLHCDWARIASYCFACCPLFVSAAREMVSCASHRISFVSNGLEISSL
jgi:hypothetical protein